ncbi:MAG: SagB/ThcOx family dehydrogenase [Elusimicrobiota bacterium]
MAKTMILALCASVFAGELKLVHLPSPDMQGGKPLMQVLKARRTKRSFSQKPLTRQQLSDLLWAAVGVNRADTGGRTAPTARNWQEIDVYVALQDGLYRYDALTNSMAQIKDKDLRGETGRQPFVADAPMNLIYVADYEKMKGASDADKAFYAATDTGFVAQNVYLFCASEGLATVVRGALDREELAKAMGLPRTQKVILVQTVGLPGKE